MSHPTQNQSLLAYLKKHQFITRRDAASKLEIMNLWARVAELEAQGHRFDRRPYTTKSGKHVLQYWLRQGGSRKRAA
jgi:predicted ArsR family transcriptional regulator